jgi:coenzyme Q-binding protein COQ10
MSAKTLEALRRLPYAPEALCAMVGDVRAYPDFIPWIEDLKVTGETEQGGVRECVAHVRVGWKHIKERFSTKVRCASAMGEVDVTLVSGPFRALRNEWRFTSDGADGAIVRFRIAYDFKNPILNGLVIANRDKVVARIMSAFEAEAARRCRLAPAAL